MTKIQAIQPRTISSGWPLWDRKQSSCSGPNPTRRHKSNHRMLGWFMILAAVAHSGCVSTGTTPVANPYGPGVPPQTVATSTPPDNSVSPLALPTTDLKLQEPLHNGSLWNTSSSSLTRDIKARRIGDILTITVIEKSQASKQSATATGKAKDFSGALDFAGMTSGDTVILNDLKTGYKGKFDNKFNGTGITSKTDSMTTYMTATVADVFPNGNLFIRGSRWTKVNDEMQEIILEGTVRPTDVNHRNEVLSQKIADAKIFIVGKGPVSAQQRPGWLGQLFDAINPF